MYFAAIFQIEILYDIRKKPWTAYRWLGDMQAPDFYYVSYWDIFSFS